MSVINDLETLQAHDEIIRELEQQLTDIPLRISQERGRLRAEEEALEEAQGAVAELKEAIERAEAHLQEKADHIVKLKQQQMTLKTNKEFAAMNIEIRQAEQGHQNAEDDLTARMLRVEPAERAEQECQAKYDAAKEGVDSYIAELEGRMAEAQAELSKYQEGRAALVAPLDVTASRRHLMYYERLRKNRWPALAKITEGVCSGCHMTVPPSKVQSARRASDVVTCDFCGRLIY